MRILIADDDDVSRVSLKALLTREGYDVVAVTDGTKAWEVLQSQNPPRLAIVDWLMDEMDGIDVCRRVREHPGLRDVYLILLTSRGDQDHIVTGLNAGANDYVIKPFNRNELVARVRVGAQMVNLHAELTARVRELDALATLDGLTGVANRRAFQARLEAELARTARYHEPLALILLDVDHFKSLNDLHGHQAGDQVLQRLGWLLTSTMRNTDFVARFGGEEFAAILVNTTKAAAEEAAERLRARIEFEPWPYRSVTVSIGIANSSSADGGAVELIRQADQALYHAKQNGRNQARHFLDMNASAEAVS